ncbi:MAG: zinc-dependent alcohol dehydrogenase family protein [Candidatus Aminicenantales bacterium]
MKAMVLTRIQPVGESSAPLEAVERPVPEPGDEEILIRVTACGVCHTELDEIEGRTPPPILPVIPGHQAAGRVERRGRSARAFKPGERVGVGWIFSACGRCAYCRSGRENLCPDFKATGRDSDGGYAEFMVVPEAFAFSLPPTLSDVETAPLLCAGAVGFRALRLAGLPEGGRLGLTGFGASGHLVLKMVRGTHPTSPVFVFARSPKEREFARELGADWAGDADERSPEKLDAIIDTTPAWTPVAGALKNLARGGRLVINAIRKEDADKTALLGLDYARDLWMEKEIKSVANVARADIRDFLALAGRIGLKPDVETFPLEEANRALVDLKMRRIRGAKVLKIG